ncbi:MAG: cold shock domain-containing protein [Candidatus Accumulibacter sp.]|nr:cold shock domain-containing protein [Accumulibacter sp.]MBN8496189.1 cold shock domain-containing protein [Accumulibacter sp.]
MRIDGTLKSWNDDRGFGFIEPSLGGQEIFVHIKAFETRLGRPQIGQRLTFEIEMNGIMEQPPHSSAGLGDAAAPVLSGELIL